MNIDKKERHCLMKLYFGSTAATVTTVLLLGLIAFIVWNGTAGRDMAHWGLKTLFLLVYGLVICCFAAARDGYDKSVQYSIDGSCAPGLFAIGSVPAIIGYIGAAIIVVAGIATVFSKSQEIRRIWFYVMSGGVVLKIAVIEIARLLH
jgi:uncharacterized membrane protein